MALALNSKASMQEFGINSIHDSSLNRKLEKLPLDLLQEIYQTLVAGICEHYAKKTDAPKYPKKYTAARIVIK